MDSSLEYVCHVFEWIESQPSRKQKEIGLRQLVNASPEINAIAKELFSIALDWYRHYGVATLPKMVEAECRETSWDAKAFFNIVGKMEAGHFRKVDQIMPILNAYPYRVARFLRACILKDLKIGVQEATVNKIWPGLIRTFSCALAEPIQDLTRLALPVLGDFKIDGVRAVAIFDGEKTSFCSRSGKELYNVDHIKKDVALDIINFGFKGGWVLDGELFSTGFNHTTSLVRSSVNPPSEEELAKLKFHVFDMIPLEEWKGTPKTVQHQRRSFLTNFIARPNWDTSSVRAVHQSLLSSVEEIETFSDRALSQGYEGIMIKNPYEPYTFDRSRAWLKYKPFDVDTYPIVGFYEGEGRNENRLGGFEIQIAPDVTCKVGGGFSDALREQYWANRDTMIGKHIAVKYKEKTPDGSLREPVFLKETDGNSAV